MSKTCASSLLIFTSLLFIALSAVGCGSFVAASTPTATLPKPTPTALPSETPASTLPATTTSTPSFTPTQSSASSSTYIVKAGDTLYQIALRYGVTLGALEQLNNLPDPNSISVGQAIIIPIPSNATPIKPGNAVDALTARQGGTMIIQVAQPNLASVTGTINNKTIPFTREAGYFYALVGISRCAKLGSLPVKLTETDPSGETKTENMTINVAATAFPVDKVTQIILPSDKTAILANTDLRAREDSQLEAVISKFTPVRLWNGVFRQPLNSYVTEYFGTRRSYNGRAPGACGHEGTDFRGAVGDAVYSDARGRVVFAALTQVRGNLVVVDHGLGVFSAYFHMSEMAVHENDMVESGDLIGKVGNLGISTGPHLHWSVWVNGQYVDPMEWTKKVFP